MSVTIMDSLLPCPSLNLKRKTPPSDHGDELAQWSTVSPEQLDVANAMGAFSTMAVETQQVGPEKPNCINEAIAADAFGTTGSEPPKVVGRENVDAPNETDSYPFNTTASETAEVVDAEKPDGPNEAIATTDADPFDTTANEIPEMVDPEKTNDPSVTDTDAQQALQMLLQVVSNFNRAPNYNANASSMSVDQRSTPSTSAPPNINHGSVFSLSSTTFQPISDFTRRPRRERTCLKCGNGYRLCKGATIRGACSNGCRYCGNKECTGHCRD